MHALFRVHPILNMNQNRTLIPSRESKPNHIIAIVLSEMYNRMKHSIRPMYSILLLVAVAATLTIVVSFHQNGPFRLKYDVWPVKTRPKPIFNETLLKYATTDLADPRLEREVTDLLKGNLGIQGILLKGNLGIQGDLLKGNRGIQGDLLKGNLGIQGRSLLTDFLTHLGNWAQKRQLAQLGVMSGLADEFKFLTGGRLGPGRQLYESCAVVGNSGILLQRNYSKAIDGHEVVIRLNNAGTALFESHVGSKTNISFVNSNILHSCSIRRNCRCSPYGADVATVTYICQPRHFIDYLSCVSFRNSPLVVTNPRFDVLCGRIIKYYSLKRFVEKSGKGVGEWGPAHGGEEFHYSSGIQAVMLAAGVCRRVGVFGFGKSETARHHYHTRQKAELKLHDYEAEYDFYRDLVERPAAVPFVESEFEFPPVVVYK